MRVILLTREEAQDLAQETWIRLAASVRSPEAGGSWRGLAISIARNADRDRRRAAGRRRKHEARAMCPVSDAGAGDPAEILERNERAELVRRAVSALDVRDRSLLLEWIGNGTSIRGLASEAGRSRSAMHGRLANICARLKADLRHVAVDDWAGRRRRVRA